MYANKVEAHHVRRAAERLGKNHDKSHKAEVQSFAQALSSSEASSSKTKGKASAKAHLKATDKPEKPNQYCNILNLPGSKNNNNRTATMAASAKSQWGLDLTEVTFPPSNKSNKKNISSSKSLYYINLISFN